MKNNTLQDYLYEQIAETSGWATPASPETISGSLAIALEEEMDVTLTDEKFDELQRFLHCFIEEEFDEAQAEWERDTESSAQEQLDKYRDIGAL